jgi:hypothetical protein
MDVCPYQAVDFVEDEGIAGSIRSCARAAAPVQPPALSQRPVESYADQILAEIDQSWRRKSFINN